MKNYPDESLDRLEAAETALERMIKATNIVAFKTEFNSFLESGNHCLMPIDKTSFNEGIEGFKEWDIEQTKSMNENALFKFFRIVRSEILKSSEDLITYDLMFKQEVVIDPGEGNITRLVRTESGVKIVRLSKTDPLKYENVKNISGMSIGNIRFNIVGNKKLKNFLEYQGVEVILLSKKYLASLREVLNEFMSKFVK